MKKIKFLTFLLSIVICGLVFSQQQSSKIDTTLYLKTNNLSDLKISLAQCAGQWNYVLILTKNGVIKFPDKDAAMQNWLRSSKDILNVANGLPGGDVTKIAEDFNKKLISRHMEIAAEHGQSQKAVELAVNLAMSGSKKCSDFLLSDEYSRALSRK